MFKKFWILLALTSLVYADIWIDNNLIDYSVVNASLLPDIFEPYPHARHIVISDIRLMSLPPNLLQHQLNLKEFGLDHTEISEVPNDFFAANKALIRINITSSKLKSVPKIVSESVISLNLYDNRISKFPIDEFSRGLPNLEVLNLSNNKLVQISRVLKTPKLRILDFSFNRINCIRNNTFFELEKLESLNLRRNRLIRLPYAGMFAMSPELRNIWLSENPFVCDCNNEEFIKSVRFFDSIQLKDKAELNCLTPAAVFHIHTICKTEIKNGIRIWDY